MFFLSPLETFFSQGHLLLPPLAGCFSQKLFPPCPPPHSSHLFEPRRLESSGLAICRELDFLCYLSDKLGRLCSYFLDIFWLFIVAREYEKTSPLVSAGEHSTLEPIFFRRLCLIRISGTSGACQVPDVPICESIVCDMQFIFQVSIAMVSTKQSRVKGLLPFLSSLFTLPLFAIFFSLFYAATPTNEPTKKKKIKKKLSFFFDPGTISAKEE